MRILSRSNLSGSFFPRAFMLIAPVMVPLTLLVLSTGAPPAVFAQAVNGAFHGTITDSTGAVIPGAQVEARNLGSGATRDVTSDEKGFYTITDLAPGHYSLRITSKGFQTLSRPDVELQVSQDAEVNDVLTVGQATEIVEVTAAPAMLTTTSSTLGQVIGNKDAVDLPLNGRQFTQLILLTPGAAPIEGGQQNGFSIHIAGGGLAPAVNGQNGGQDSFTLDGVINNHPYIQVYVIAPPPDALEEFKTQNHISDAQFSFSSGANVNIVTKTGSDKLHGDLWEFVRDDVLNSANYIDNLTGTPKPSYLQNQYGFTVGGPVMFPHLYDGRRNNTHWFGFWEGFKSDQGITGLAGNPTATELSGDFSDLLTGAQATTSTGAPAYDALGRAIMVGQLYNPYSTRTVNGQLVRDPIPNNNITSVMPLNAIALKYLNATYYAPNYGPGGNSYPNYSFVADTIVTSNQFGGNLDHVFKNNDTVFAKFYYSEPTQTTGNSQKYGAGLNLNHAKMITAGYTHLFSPTLLTSARFGYTWMHYGLNVVPAGESLISEVNSGGFLPTKDGIPLIPEFTIGPRSFTGSSQFAVPMGPTRIYQFNDDVEKTKGSHSISTGFLYLHTHSFDDGFGGSFGFDQYPTSALIAGDANVSSTGDGLASMLMDLPSTFNVFTGITYADIKNYWLGAYVQDKWQVSRKLNIQFGMRWDFQAPPHYKNNIFSMWNTNCPLGNYNTPDSLHAIQEQCLLMPYAYNPAPTPTNPNPLTWPVPNIRSTIFAPQYNGFQPRLGIAYSLDSKTVIRAGFNVFDDHNAFTKDAQDARGSWPSGGQTIPAGLNRQVPSTFLDNPPTAASFLQGATPVFGRAGDPNSKIPYSLQYNLGVQRELNNNTTFQVTYVGSVSRRLWGTVGYNAPLPQNMGPNAQPAGEPFPFINGTIQGDENKFWGNYNGIQGQLQRRFAQGLQFIAAYTYSKCLNVDGGEFDAYPQNSYDVAADYGPCQQNFPHLFVFSAVYALPFGQGERFGGGVGKAMNFLVGGWNISDITQIHSGVTFSTGVSADNANTGTTQRANYVPGCQLKPAGFHQSVKEWYNPACFVVPPEYTFGNTERNGFRGPDYDDSDIAIFKNFNFTESKYLQFRAESYNTLNRTNFSPPGGSATGSSAQIGGTVSSDIDSSTFMQILSAAPARQIQFAMKFVF
jgi:Carboxypeptidase regulatory-like domain